MTPEDKAQKELNERLFNDLVTFGECAYKTELESGRSIVKYIDPISDELRVAIYNAEHRDSQMSIDPISIYLSRETTKCNFRLPRKIKKIVKNNRKVRFSPYELKFQHEAWKMSKYYGCKILLERAIK